MRTHLTALLALALALSPGGRGAAAAPFRPSPTESARRRGRAHDEEVRRREAERAAESRRIAEEEAEAVARADDARLAAAATEAHEEGRRALVALDADVARAAKAIAADKRARLDGFMALPDIAYAPETKLLIGGYVLYFRHLGDPDETRPSTFELGASATTKGQFTGEVDIGLWLARNAVNLRLETEARLFPDLYFGIGKRTTPANAEAFTQRSLTVEPAAMFRVVGDLYVGAKGVVDSRATTEVEPGRELAAGTVPGSEGGTVLGGEPALSFDSRDAVFGTKRGTLVEVGQRFARSTDGRAAFTVTTLDARQFFPLGRDVVLGFQVGGQSAYGTVPFYLLPRLGGDRLRGVFLGRYRDKHMIEGQVELRYPIYWRFGGTLFGAAGQVAERLDAFTVRDVVPAGGAGLRFAVIPAERINLRLDFAYAPEGLLYYLTLGEAF